jgi:DNA-binding NtrC family response regulator
MNSHLQTKMIQQPKILYVDDEPENLEAFRIAFDSEYPLKTALSGEEALKIATNEEVALVISDQRMPGMTGIELCEKLFQTKPDTIRMILTAYTDTELLLSAIRRGHVQDYIVKPWKKSALKPIIDKALQEYQQRKEKMRELESHFTKVQVLEEEILQIYDNRGIVGMEVGLKRVMEVIKKAAPSDSTVLLLGETGTGKELLARAIHAESKRKNHPFIPVHCAALAKTLLESELFGHEKGAFTGADQARVGRFELANHGTIFLDEIGEIPEEIQVKLLRVLQEREIQRVGGNRLIPIEVRLVAATNKDLKKEVDQGRFREDLFYRLNVIPIKVPPLRDRKEDISVLATYFLHKYTRKTGAKMTLSEKALEYLARYDWPGNVRELENTIERAVILNASPVIDPEDLDLHLEEMLQVENVDLNKISGESSLRSQIQQQEEKNLKEILVKAGGNISKAARLLEIPRSTLFRRLKKYGLI